MKKFLSILFIALMMAAVIPLSTSADEFCYPGETIYNEDVINVFEEDGEIYIDVFESYQEGPALFAVGKCPSAKKTKTFTKTRDELVSEVNGLKLGHKIISKILGTIFPIISDFVEDFISQGDLYSGPANAALIQFPNKQSFTGTVYMECHQTIQGSRGWTHRYKITGYRFE